MKNSTLLEVVLDEEIKNIGDGNIIPSTQSFYITLMDYSLFIRKHQRSKLTRPINIFISFPLIYFMLSYAGLRDEAVKYLYFFQVPLYYSKSA